MPRKDKYHDAVRTALEKDGWTITDDPLMVQAGDKDFYIDLGAEKFIAAIKDDDRIAVEIKTLAQKAMVFDYYQSLGQYLVYRLALERSQQERTLYMAVPENAFEDYTEIEIFKYAWDYYSVNLLVFDQDNKTISQWIKK